MDRKRRKLTRFRGGQGWDISEFPPEGLWDLALIPSFEQALLVVCPNMGVWHCTRPHSWAEVVLKVDSPYFLKVIWMVHHSVYLEHYASILYTWFCRHKGSYPSHQNCFTKKKKKKSAMLLLKSKLILKYFCSKYKHLYFIDFPVIKI